MAPLLLLLLLLLVGQQGALSTWACGLLLGSPCPVGSGDSMLRTILHDIADAFNRRSNDAFLFRASAVVSARQQLVRGIRYIVQLDISRTVCHKRDKDADLSKCDFQPHGRLHQTLHCSCDVWKVPWLHRTEKMWLRCTS